MFSNLSVYISVCKPEAQGARRSQTNANAEMGILRLLLRCRHRRSLWLPLQSTGGISSSRVHVHHPLGGQVLGAAWG